MIRSHGDGIAYSGTPGQVALPVGDDSNASHLISAILRRSATALSPGLLASLLSRRPYCCFIRFASTSCVQSRLTARIAVVNTEVAIDLDLCNFYISRASDGGIASCPEHDSHSNRAYRHHEHVRTRILSGPSEIVCNLVCQTCMHSRGRLHIPVQPIVDIAPTWR